MNALFERIKEFSVPELCDGAVEYKTMDYQIKPMVTQQRIAGYALTVDVPYGEGQLVTSAIEIVKPGEIIVIAGKGNCESSYWGDHRSFCARFQKAEGVVIDGAFRDIEGCEEIGFPVYARGVTPGTAGKTGAGKLNVSVNCGGVLVNPGDIIVADRNGVIVIDPKDIELVLERAEKKISDQKKTVALMLETGKVMPRVIKSE